MMDNLKDSFSIERYQFRGYDFLILIAALSMSLLWIFDMLLLVNKIEDSKEYITAFGTGFRLLYVCSFIILPIILAIEIFISIVIIFNLRTFLNSKVYSYSFISNIPFYLKTNNEDQKLVIQMFLDRLLNFQMQGSVKATESQKSYLNFYLKQVKIKNIIIYSSNFLMLIIMLIHAIMELTMDKFSILYLVISIISPLALYIQIKNFIEFLTHYHQLKNTLFYYKCEEEEQV